MAFSPARLNGDRDMIREDAKTRRTSKAEATNDTNGPEYGPCMSGHSREFVLIRGQKPFAFLRALASWRFKCLLVLLVVGCGRRLPGSEEVPPGVAKIPGVFEDVGPRWSHDGRQIAFLRHTSDRKYQLCIASADLKRVTAILGPELISPDRAFQTSRGSYRAPGCLAWSADDRSIVFPRVEWMTFPDSEKLPGTGLWAYDLFTRKTSPLAIHPKDYKGSLYFYRSPAWSSDGKHIAFIGEGLRGETALFVIPTSGAKPEVENPRYDSFLDTGWPAWSPDGKRLVFRQGIRRGYTADPVEAIRLIEPGGTVARRLWATTPVRYDQMVRQVPLVVSAGSQGAQDQGAPKVAGIAWSADGARLAFTVARDPTDPLTSAIWTLDMLELGGKPRAAPGIDPSNQDGYAAPIWIDSDTLGAIRIRDGGGFTAVSIGLRPDPQRYFAMETIANLPTADMDWSPDRKWIVVAGPGTTPAHGREPLSTTIEVIPTGR